MDQGRIQNLVKPIIISAFMGLTAISGCKDRGEGPKSPDSNPQMTEGTPAPGTGDAVVQKPETPNIPGTGPVAPVSNGNALPEKFMTGLADCQKLGRYYDLQLASCTELALSSFPCDMTVLLSEQSAVLSTEQKRLLKDYVDKNLQGFSLYACTVEEAKPALHFYKVEADKIRAHNVKIAPP